VTAMSKRRTIDSGRLPCNTHRYMESGSRKTLYLWYPSQLRTFSISPKDDAQCYPIPSVLIKFEFNNDKLDSTYLWATDSLFLQAHNPPLYYFPFGNVHCDSLLCWGSVKCKLDYSPPSIDYNVGLIFASAYNDDLGRNIGKFGYGHKDSPSLNYLKKLKNKDMFPEDQLIRHTYLNEA